MNKKIVLQILIFLMLAILTSCSTGFEDMDYIEKTTGLKFKNDYKVMEGAETDFSIMKVIKLSDTSAFTARNRRKNIPCPNTFFGEEIPSLKSYLDKMRSPMEIRTCYGGSKDQVSWKSVLNERLGLLYVEIAFPDFSGD